VRVPSLITLALLAAALAGCGRFDHAERPAWRDQAEAACLAQHLVEATQFLQPAAEIDGPGICGLHHPFRVYALAGGTVRLHSASLLDCSMIPTLDAWVRDVLQPDAQARFGEPVAQINTMGTYSCRGINNRSGAGLSEHAFGNAIDIGGFVLASGRELNVMRGWSGQDAQESAFLHEAHAGACTYFTTVLGPGSNSFHYNHVHLDLAMHGNTSRGPRRYCKPVSQTQVAAPKRDNLPDPPPIEEELDMAQAPAPQPSLTPHGGASFVATAPESSPVYRPHLPEDADMPAGENGARFAGSPSRASLALAPLPRGIATDTEDPDEAARAGAPDAVDPDTDVTGLIESQAGR
jgi:hypothetical protein